MTITPFVTRSRRRSAYEASRAFRLWALRRFPRCQWCNCHLDLSTATADHLWPVSRGGTDAWSNLCLACRPCNAGRRNAGRGERPRFGPADWHRRWLEENGLRCRPAEQSAPPAPHLHVLWAHWPAGWRPAYRGALAACHRQRLHLLHQCAKNPPAVSILPVGQQPEGG